MFASSHGPRSAAQRRGIVLVLVLGMLGLMALIGVTFATFAGQSLKNGRNFSQGVARPQAEAMMDYALAQLINDTNNPLSAIRGHSLLRDMYGNDSVYRGANPPANAAVETGGLMDRVYVGGSYSTLHLALALGLHPHSASNVTPFYNSVQYVTNIPIHGQYQGLDFTRWILRFPGSTTTQPTGNSGYPFTQAFPYSYVSQSFEVLEDDATGTNYPYHVFTLSSNLGNPTGNDSSYVADNSNNGAATATVPGVSSSDWTTFLYNDGNLGATVTGTAVAKNYTHLLGEFNTNGTTAGTLSSGGISGSAFSSPFVLDGRYMRAFNGAGMTRPSFPVTDPTTGSVVFTPAYPYNPAAYANMRVIGSDPAVASGNYITGPTSLYGLGNPDAIGMDEDYDACDLENWFLAIQSADGQVMIPSFHRPGILSADDWTAAARNSSGNVINAARRSKILRPRQTDNSPLFPADPSVVNTDLTSAQSGKLTYDIDNDGDGVTDSVWLDLGYPVQRDPNGKLYKPLFAFMILGLNGRMPLNTVGNLQARAIGDPTNNVVGGTPAVTYPTSSGQVPYPGNYAGASTVRNPLLSSQVFFDTPLYDHTSHIGFSVNEINPKFALQNAPSNMFPASGPDATGTSYSQYDNVGVSVATTQLRNLLAGTMVSDLPSPYKASLPPSGSYLTQRTSTTNYNDDMNVVTVNGQAIIFPNNVADNDDHYSGTGTSQTVTRIMPPVPGRWGEPEGIPKLLPYPVATNTFDPSYPIYNYNNPVRAGRSFYVASSGTNDAMDDDFDGLDPYLPNTFQVPLQGGFSYSLLQNSSMGTTPYSIPMNSAAAPTSPVWYRQHPEDVDGFDHAGQAAIASERIRRFVMPHDPAGVGRLVGRNTGALVSNNASADHGFQRPLNEHDFGTGMDSRGRVGHFRYFRPAGMPQEVRYPYGDAGSLTTTDFSYTPYATNSGTGHQFLMPMLMPAGRSVATSTGPVSNPDVSNNQLNGLQSMATPEIVTITGPPATTSDASIAVMGAMPYDLDPQTGASPNGYAKNVASPNTISLFSPTIAPLGALLSNINTETGPNLGAIGNPAAGGAYPIPYVPPYDGTGSYDATGVPTAPMVVNGYLGGSLNKDEADEMNLYANNVFDMAYGPTDLEWLYRKHDVDGATLTSRLAQLAPISFLNPADGLTRRRMFSTDTWELNNYVYANDNPVPYAGVLGGYGGIHSPDHDFNYNSRFGSQASPSFEIMNQVVSVPGTDGNIYPGYYQFANPITTEFLPNPTLPSNTLAGGTIGNGTAPGNYIPNSNYLTSPLTLPLTVDNTNANSTALPFNMYFHRGNNGWFTNAVVNQYTNVIIPSGSGSAAQVTTPSIAHRDRKINLNFPLPISNDPAEPIRQKWCRETYQMLKAILPPASVDTAEELAALSQFVVNVIDFRDPDCTMTRFVNTDLEVTDVLTKQLYPQLGTSAGVPTLDPTWSVSPSGVRFTQTPIPGGHFPYDPSIYNPDATSNYLVQHGMENNPLVINEAMAYTAMANQTAGGNLVSYQAMFIELVNMLTDSQNANNTGNNSSSLSLSGWDIVVLPDNYGWGRPDPITGNLNPVVDLGFTPDPAGDATMPPDDAKRHIPLTATDPVLSQIATATRQYGFRDAVAPAVTAKVHAMHGDTGYTKFVIGDYRVAGATVADPTTIEGTNAVAKQNEIDVRLPTTFSIPTPTTATSTGSAYYYWVYLRRPANPFDVAQPNQVRPNKEMVVVDSMRFPAIDAGTATVMSNGPNAAPTVTRSPNAIFSAGRLQPNRGGHLVRVDTPAGGSAPPTGTIPPTMGTPASGTTKIAPPSPAYAYGYSEQMAAPPTGNGTGIYTYTTTANGTTTTATRPTTSTIQQSINNNNPNSDTNWQHFPFHDRDFSNVAELLLVPGCPPGLFTKQFVEEPYPGNVFTDAARTMTATGTDDRDLAASLTAAPTSSPNPSRVGRQDFAVSPALSATPPGVTSPTYPYLTDNFYYTAASVAPPMPGTGSTLDPNYTHLTTEIGGWTGTGWHKMMELFEVPSSANGAIGTADGGANYDWNRADIKPGLLNLNLIIDEEVFAGLIDDPRLNELIAAVSGTTFIPYVVTQIDSNGPNDSNGYPSYDTTTGIIHGRYPIFPNTQLTVNEINGAPATYALGRGYTYRDPLVTNYPPVPPNTGYGYQQLHGLKAAFSDFLKLRHGGSGYLFAHGGGDVGMGDFTTGPLALPAVTQPIAADRPYRSLSYPDINYTIMRPASLPPAPANTTFSFLGTTPNLPTALGSLFTYNLVAGAPYVQLSQLLAPMNDTTLPYQYIFDPGIKNPYLSVQYTNKTNPSLAEPTAEPFPTLRRLAPPYETTDGPTATAGAAKPIAAPFPPPIPPAPARRLFQIPDGQVTSNASISGQYDSTATLNVNRYPVNEQVITPMVSAGQAVFNPAAQTPPTLIPATRAVFAADNYTPQSTIVNNYLGATGGDLRQHPVYRTEMLQKISNLTTVRTHQFAAWITVGFFEVVKSGTPELGIPDVLGQEVGTGTGDKVRYRSFFVIDRTKATGFNPYYPGNFRDCVTYRRRIE